MEHGTQYFADVAVFLAESFRHAGHKVRRRIVRDKTHRQLARDKFSGGRMVRQNVQHLVAFALAVFADLVSQHIFCARLMRASIDLDAAAGLRLVIAPAGEYLGQFRYIFLAVPAFDYQGVQLHDLSRVIFIQAAGTVLVRLLRPGEPGAEAAPATFGLRTVFCQVRIGTDALPVVQVEQNGRTFGRGRQQIFEFTQRMRTDHFTLIRSEHVTVRAFADEDVEVVEPEVRHHFIQLALAVDVAQELGRRQFPAYNYLRINNGLYRLLLLRLHAFYQLHGPGSAIPSRQIQPALRIHLHNALVPLLGRHR